MDFIYPLRVVWRATLQSAYEKWAARFRDLQGERRFDRRDRSLDARAIDFYRRLTPSAAPPLKLVGGPSDGGYLVPDFPPARLALFSAGVGHVVDFEYEFAELGCPVFLADGTVSKPPRAHPNFFFEPQNIGLGKSEISLDSWINGRTEPSQPLAIQMDIEGAEWAALLRDSISDNTLSRVQWMVVEFHAFERFWSEKHFPGMSLVLDRLLKTFLPIAVHSNNCASGLNIEGRRFPRVFEVTFLNRSLESSASPEHLMFPDFQNCPNRPRVDWPIS